MENPYYRPNFYAGCKGPGHCYPIFVRAVKALVIVTLSESFTIRPRLPFQVNLRFAKTEPWLSFCSFEIPEYTPKLPRWLAGLLSRLGLLIIANYYDAAAMVLHSARCRTTCAEKKQRLNAAAFSPLRPFPPPDARRARLIERRARQQC